MKSKRKRTKKLGNLFALASKRLMLEESLGMRESYGLTEILDYGYKIRKFLDRNHKKIPEIMNLTREEKKLHSKESKRRYILKRKD